MRLRTSRGEVWQPRWGVYSTNKRLRSSVLLLSFRPWDVYVNQARVPAPRMPPRAARVKRGSIRSKAPKLWAERFAWLPLPAAATAGLLWSTLCLVLVARSVQVSPQRGARRGSPWIPTRVLTLELSLFAGHAQRVLAALPRLLPALLPTSPDGMALGIGAVPLAGPRGGRCRMLRRRRASATLQRHRLRPGVGRDGSRRHGRGRVCRLRSRHPRPDGDSIPRPARSPCLCVPASLCRWVAVGAL